MTHRPVTIVTSVLSRVVDDLALAVGRAVDDVVEVRTGLDGASWASARAEGRLTSALIRMRGLLFPLLVDLGPRATDRVIIATTNPFLLPACVAFRRRRALLVTLVYDLYPESLEVTIRVPRPLKALIRAVTAFGLRRSRAVVFLGDRTRDYIVDRYSLICPTAVIPPGCGEVPRPSDPPQSLASLARELEEKVVVSYVGNMGSVHDATTLAEALRRVLTSRSGGCAVVISARGDRAADLIGPLADLPEVTLLEHLDHDEWVWLTHRTDVALISLDARAGLVSLPSKVFSSLAGGAAILAVAPEDSDLADLVRRLGVGLVVAPGDPDAAARQLAELIEDAELRTNLGAAAAAASVGFSVEALASRWSSVLGVVEAPGSTRPSV